MHNRSSIQSKYLDVWLPAHKAPPQSKPLVSITLACKVVSPTIIPHDFLIKLKKTWASSIYKNYIKRYSFARRVVQWVWRSGIPLYINNVYPLLNKDMRQWRSLVQYSLVAELSHEPSYDLINESIVETMLLTVFPEKNQHLLGSKQAQYTFPKIFVATVPNAMIYGGTNLVLTDKQVLCHDLYNFHQDYTSEELHCRAIINPRDNCIRWLSHDNTPGRIPVAASFVDSCAANYAHWVTEVLPRICLFCSDSRFDDIPIIINDGLHSNLIESLYLVCGNRAIFSLPIGQAMTVDKLYIMSPSGYVPFEKRPGKFIKPPSDALFSPDALQMLRDRLRDKLSMVRSDDFPKKIYLRRGTSIRKLINESEIEAILVARGFSIISTERLTFAEQVVVFQNAEVIIGPTGAACANIIFSNPLADIVILMGTHENMPYRYWLNMSSAVGVKKICYILGDIVQNKELDFHGDYQININELHNYLNKLWENR